MLSRFVTVAAFMALSSSACFQAPMASIGSVNISSNRTTALATTQAKSVTGVSANATESVQLNAPSIIGMEGAGVTIQPGTLGISVNLVIEQAADLGDSDLATEIGLAEDIQVSTSTPGMIIRPSETTDLKRPMTISMPLPASTGLHLAGSKYVIFYKHFDPSEQRLITGIKAVDGVQAKIIYDDKVGRERVDFEGYFGAYWVAALSREVATADLPAPKPADQPIMNKSLTVVVATTAMLPEKEVVKNEAIPVVQWKKPDLVLNDISRSVLLSALAPDGQSLASCKADFYESPILQSGVSLDTAGSLKIEYSIKSTRASTLVGRFRCLDALGRVTISPWSDIVSITAAPVATDTPILTQPIVIKEPGVDSANGDIVSLSGVLSPRRELLLFTLNPGDSRPVQRPVPVDASGYFEFKVDRGSSASLKLLAKINANPIVRDAALTSDLSAYFGETEAHVLSFLAEQSLDAGLRAELLPDINARIAEGQMLALVSFEPVQGNPSAEAATFKNVGLPITAGAGLFALPTRSIKGHLRLGTITLNAQVDAYAQLNAALAFNETPSTLAGISRFGRNSSYLKNHYINPDWRGNISFLWRMSNTLNNVVGTFLDPNLMIYKGYNFYAHNDQPGFGFDDICGSVKKPLEFAAPSTVITILNGVPLNLTGFSNSSATMSGASGARTCNGSGFYAREEGSRLDFNFGSGALLTGAVPTGFWKLKYNGAELAKFDYSSFRPLDELSKPRVPVPNIKFVKTANSFTGAVIKFSTFDNGAYSPVTDLSFMKKLIRSPAASLWGGAMEHRAPAHFVEGSSELTVTFDPPVPDTSVFNGAFEYDLGDQTYRFEVGM
jgi:hypothetical protein